MINKKYIYAIVGASNNKDKYGFKVLNDLQNKGFLVVPINPKEKIIAGLKTYKNIKEANNIQKIDVVIFVVPPQIGLKIIKEVKSLGIKKVWLQPGAENNELIEFCRKNKIECVYNACIMLGS